ncbi:MAG: hypothetical protein WCF65_03640 [Parachlamydiaceae bacterium]
MVSPNMGIVSIPSAPPAPVVGSGASASVDAGTAGAIAQAHGNPANTATTKVASVADLKRKAPKVYQQMMEGIAMNICNNMKASQDRISAMNKGN